MAGMHSYLYDGNGALTHVKTADGAVTQQAFTYHPTGLMNSATFQGGSIVNVWDADEHRVGFTATGGTAPGTYAFVFDVAAGIPAILAENTPTEAVYYIREPGGELIARISGSDIHYYHFDELGSTRLITDENGAITDRFTYDADGAVLSHTSDTGSVPQPYQYVGRLGYYTHYMHPEFGWLQLGVRFYEPELGRFERRDPVREEVASRYWYADGNPIAFHDPNGLRAKDASKDAALRKCLSRIRKCFPCLTNTIQQTQWQLDPNLPREIGGETDFVPVYGYTGMTMCHGTVRAWGITGYRPRIRIGVEKMWQYRNMLPQDFHRFCAMVYHEVRHANASAWNLYCQKSSESYWGGFWRQTDEEYYAKGSCLTNGHPGDISH